MKTQISLILSAVLLLAGCATDRCSSDTYYRQSQMAAPLVAPPGLSLPGEDPSTTIPDLAENPSRKTGRRADGSCLELPPGFIKPR